jgi:hypothetical protein
MHTVGDSPWLYIGPCASIHGVTRGAITAGSETSTGPCFLTATKASKKLLAAVLVCTPSVGTGVSAP